MSNTERSVWELVKLSRELADAPAAQLLLEAPGLQEVARNIEAALARARKEQRHAA